MWFRKRHNGDERTPSFPAEECPPVLSSSEEETAPEDWREPDALSGSESLSDEREAAVRPFGGRSVRRKRGIRIGQFFTGGVLSQEEFTHRLPVIVYVVFLMLLYIANGFRIQHKHSELDRIADELKQLKTQAVTSSAVRMTLTRRSEIERLLREHEIPLVQDGTVPHVIEN